MVEKSCGMKRTLMITGVTVVFVCTLNRCKISYESEKKRLDELLAKQKMILPFNPIQLNTYHPRGGSFLFMKSKDIKDKEI